MLSTISKVDDERHLVFAEVYPPLLIDSQSDYMQAETIEKMAHRFMAQGRVTKVDTEHDQVDNGCYIVESFIARKGDPDFIPGSWVVGIHIPDPTLWTMVKSGELNGLSLFGKATRTPMIVEVELPDDGTLAGETAKAEDHTHEYRVQFSAKGEFLGGETDIVAGHSHKITRGTATDVAENHTHRFSFLERLL